MASPSFSSTKVRLPRAPRVFVPNREKVRIATGSQPPVIGTIHKLSSTGGSVRLDKFFGHGVVAEITMQTVSGVVRSPIQFLRTGVDGLASAQAFRFVHMRPEDQTRLATILSELRAQGFGESSSNGLSKLHGIARRALSVLQADIF